MTKPKPEPIERREVVEIWCVTCRRYVPVAEFTRDHRPRDHKPQPS